MVKLACLTWPYKDVSFERALEGISRAGYKYVVIGLPHMGVEFPDEKDDQSVDKLKAIFHKYQLEPTMLVGNDQFSPGQPLERARKRLQTAKALGIKEVVSIGTCSYRKFPTEPFTEEEMVPINARFAEHFKQIADEADLLDLILSLKPHTGNTATAAEIMKTLKQIDKRNVGGSYDPGNVHYYEGVNAAADFPQMAEHTYSLLIKDHRGGKGNPDLPVPGTGEVDFPQIFASLKKVGFQGNIAVERVSTAFEEPGLTDQLITETRIQMERMLKEAGFELS